MNRPWWMPEKLDALYGAIVASLIAFVSSFLTNRHALKRQKIELAHQAEQKERERQQALKREVYLPLLEAASAAVAFVVQVARVPLESLSRENPMSELMKQIAKLNLIAPPAVIEPVTQCQTYLSKCYMMVTNERLAIEKLAAELASIDSSIEGYSNQQRGVLTRLERHLDQGTGDPALRQALCQIMENASKEMAALQRRRLLVVKEKCELELNLGRRAYQEMKPLRAHMSAGFLAIRKDLGMAIDERWWTALTEASSKEIDAALNHFFAEMERRHQEAFASLPAGSDAESKTGRHEERTTPATGVG